MESIQEQVRVELDKLKNTDYRTNRTLRAHYLEETGRELKASVKQKMLYTKPVIAGVLEKLPVYFDGDELDLLVSYYRRLHDAVPDVVQNTRNDYTKWNDIDTDKQDELTPLIVEVIKDEYSKGDRNREITFDAVSKNSMNLFGYRFKATTLRHVFYEIAGEKLTNDYEK
jgi:hypothetical protein